MNLVASSRSSVLPPHNVRVDLDGRATSSERVKLQQAAQTLESVIHRHEFLQSLKDRFGNRRGAEIFEKIAAGAERHSPKADRESDLEIAFLRPSARRRNTVAWSTSNRERIYLNRDLFEKRSVAQVARTLGHMQTYKLGFDGNVAAAVGQIVERVAKLPPANRPTPAPAPAPTPTPTPAPNGPGRTVSTREIFTGFRQGGTGNCVSIAAIKAGMVRFGVDGVFAKQTRSNGGYDIVMRDGYKVRITDAEIATASSYSKMRGSNTELLQDANLMFAAMAKRAQQEGNDRRRGMNFVQACKTLNDGENYKEGPHWLGLGKYVRTINPKDMDRYPAVIAASTRHAVFGAGRQIDHYGTARNAFNSNGVPVEGHGRTLRWAIAIV